jgi:hypothetical protein
MSPAEGCRSTVIQNNEHTSWSKFLLEKLIIAQFVGKFLTIYVI